MKRLAKISLVAGCVLVLGFFAYGALVVPIVWESTQRKQGISALKAASSEDERTSAVGRLGLTQTYPDGSWIAIFYADSHAGRIQSLAVVRDSDNNWFESTHHFCGAFSAARYRYQLYSDPEIDQQSIPDPEWLGDVYAILSASNIADARVNLDALGFTPVAH